MSACPVYRDTACASCGITFVAEVRWNDGQREPVTNACDECREGVLW